MLELAAGLLFLWLLFKISGLLFRLAWGATKIIAVILLAAAFPALLFGLIFAGGVVLLIPAGLLLLVWMILSTLA